MSPLSSKASPSRVLALVILFITASGFAGIVFAQHASSERGYGTEIPDNLKSFTQIYSLIEDNYADPVSPDKAIYNGAIPGMLHVLDPHSNFLDPKAYASLREEQRGKYYGIGMQIGRRENKIFIAFAFAGSPAYRAGLRAGDVIAAVDGKPTDDMTTSDVVALVKGPRNTSVRVSILRGDSVNPFDVNVVRDEIPLHSVDVHFEIKPGIGYMRITNFGETTDEEVGQALEEFGDLKGLIIDLRQNPGGLLSAAVGVADKFLKAGSIIVSQRGRASAEQAYRATKGNAGKDYPIVVLINRGSASASEIVAGALQGHDRTRIAGEIRFGKGLVQSVYNLSDNTGLLLTTAHYYTPSGRLIQREYTGKSLYDYYTERTSDTTNKEVKVTDSGRTVYGGGGITPDENLVSPKLNPLQIRLLQKFSFFNFGAQYLNQKDIKVSPDFEVSDAVVQDFRKYLEKTKVEYTEPELVANMDWVKASLKSSIFTGQFGQEEGQKALTSADTEVAAAINLLPKAKALAEGSRKIVAQRAAAHGATAQ